MIFQPTSLPGAYVVEVERLDDERGFFARTFCAAEFAAHGIDFEVQQSSISHNAKRATLRGMHFQSAPHEERKLVRCTAGAAFDVIVDVRPQSATYLQWFSVELSAANRRALYIPAGCAHGFLSLADDTEMAYSISIPFVAGAGRGLRWNDPKLGIGWPLRPAVISARDAEYALLV